MSWWSLGTDLSCLQPLACIHTIWEPNNRPSFPEAGIWGPGDRPTWQATAGACHTNGWPEDKPDQPDTTPANAHVHCPGAWRSTCSTCCCWCPQTHSRGPRTDRLNLSPLYTLTAQNIRRLRTDLPIPGHIVQGATGQSSLLATTDTCEHHQEAGQQALPAFSSHLGTWR